MRANFSFFLNDALISRRATSIERYHQGTKACTAEHIFQLLDASLAPTATGLLPIMSSLAKLKTPHSVRVWLCVLKKKVMIIVLLVHLFLSKSLRSVEKGEKNLCLTFHCRLNGAKKGNLSYWTSFVFLQIPFSFEKINSI